MSMYISRNTKKTQQTNRGFTLLETMVAIFILVLSITGPMVFAQSGLRAAFLARDQITAFFLAQDAIETIKNLRDENGLNGDAWLTNICTDSPCTVYIDTTEENPVTASCVGGVCNPLETDAFGRFVYGLNPPNPSRFTRTITVNETVPNIEAQLIVEVSWDSNVRVGDARIVVQENIYNWIPIVQ